MGTDHQRYIGRRVLVQVGLTTEWGTIIGTHENLLLGTICTVLADRDGVELSILALHVAFE